MKKLLVFFVMCLMALSMNAQNTPYVIYGYLKVFPNDLGNFDAEPRTIIARLNQNQQYGYDTWRLPTNEELALMCANNVILTKENYMTKEHPIGIVRLVTDGENISVTSFISARQNYVENASGLDMKMIWVDGGEFTMGCTSEQGEDCFSDEKNVRKVKVDGFYIGMLEVTQAQWKMIMGPKYINPEYGVGDDYPVSAVSWEEADEFCRRLSSLTNLNYTLPTEAQWEYAARGGKNHDDAKYSGSNMLDAVGWHEGNSGGKSHVCGTKRANSLGIYDMSGNVMEWCKDWYTDTQLMEETPTGLSPVPLRALRAGSWHKPAKFCRVSCRGYGGPGGKAIDLGFRVVLIP